MGLQETSDYFHKFKSTEDFRDVAFETIQGFRMDMYEFFDAIARSDEFDYSDLDWVLFINQDDDAPYISEGKRNSNVRPLDSLNEEELWNMIFDVANLEY